MKMNLMQRFVMNGSLSLGNVTEYFDSQLPDFRRKVTLFNNLLYVAKVPVFMVVIVVMVMAVPVIVIVVMVVVIIMAMPVIVIVVMVIIMAVPVMVVIFMTVTIPMFMNFVNCMPGLILLRDYCDSCPCYAMPLVTADLNPPASDF